MTGTKVSELPTAVKLRRGDRIVANRGGTTFQVIADQTGNSGYYAISVASRTAGDTINPNTLLGEGWENPTQLCIFSASSWGATNCLYISDVVYGAGWPCLKTVDESMDHEVTTWTRSGYVYLRMDSTGKGFYVHLNGENHTATLGFTSNLRPHTMSTTVVDTYDFLAAAEALGYNGTATANDLWTIGIQGYDIYLKYNGTLLKTWKNIGFFQPNPGKLGLAATSTSYGFRNIEVVLFDDCYESALLRTKKTVDLKSCGMSTVVAHGDMTASSTALTIDSDPGFVVGDKVVVEIGGEAGLGALKTKGVGGAWPSLSYANATAMNADTSQGIGTYCYLEDTKAVYGWWGSSWDAVPVTRPYTRWAVPLSLVSTIQSIADISSPNVVTNGDFASGDLSAWSAVNSGSYSIVAGKLQVTSAGGASSGAALVFSADGESYYKCTIDVTLGTATSVTLAICSTADGVTATSFTGKQVVSASGSFEITGKNSTSPGSLYLQVFPSTGGTASVDNIVISKVPSGKVLTLTDAAQVDTTDAVVYRVIDDVWNSILDSSLSYYGSFVPNDLTILLPAGNYAAADVLGIGQLERQGWTFTGEGPGVTTIFSPNGVLGASIIGTVSHFTLRNFTIRGNQGPNGYGMSSYPITGQFLYQHGIRWQTSDNVLISNIEAVNVWQSGAAFSYCWNSIIERVVVRMDYGLDQYVQWMLNAADSTDCTIRDCEVHSPTMIAGIETFRSYHTKIQRIKLFNAGASSNSSGGFLFEDIEFYIQPGSSSPGWSIYNPLLNINSNIQPPNAEMNEGGTIRRVRHVLTGPVDEFYYSPRAIVVNAYNPNVTIEGTYDGTNTVHPDILSMPDYVVGQTVGYAGSTGVNSTGENTIVRNIRVKGKSEREVLGYNVGNINLTGTGSVCENCVADNIYVPNGTTSGNRTNAVYDRGP